MFCRALKWMGSNFVNIDNWSTVHIQYHGRARFMFIPKGPAKSFMFKRKMMWFHRFIKGQHPYCIYMAIRKDHDQNLAIFGFFFLPSPEICAELCCQSTWYLGHLPELSAKFEPWMKHCIVLDINQHYILKLILLNGKKNDFPVFNPRVR